MTNRISIALLVIFAASDAVAGQVTPNSPERSPALQPQAEITLEWANHTVTLAHDQGNSAGSTKVDTLPDELPDHANFRRGYVGHAHLATSFGGPPPSTATLSMPFGTTVLIKSNDLPLIDRPSVSSNHFFRSLIGARRENNCPHHCAFLFSVRLGPKTRADTAASADALSIHLGAFMFAPGGGTGQNPLLKGIYLGQTISEVMSSSSLPTANHWTMGGGFALSYAIPALRPRAARLF